MPLLGWIQKLNSYGAPYELETQLIIIDELLLISKKAEIAVLVNDINKIQKMINNLITKLKAN